MAVRANRPHTGADTARQLELFDDTLAKPEHARAELPVAKETLLRSNASLEVVPIEPAEPDEPAYGGSHAGSDRATLAAIETALADARAAADDRPGLVVLASRLGELGTQPARPPAGALSLRQARDDWLRRLEASQKSESALVAYRVAIDDPLDWAEANGRSVLEEATIVDRAGIEKHVTAHTLRHTAATWLRQELGDTRLVAEYLGHADLSTVARYAHVDRDELFDAASRLEQLAAPMDKPPAQVDIPSAGDAEPDQSRAPDASPDDASTESGRPSRRRRRRRRRRR